jgi:hypothetical protein
MGSVQRYRRSNLDSPTAQIREYRNRIPSVQDAIGYLTSLTGKTRDHAKSYIERMPVQISTPHRHAIAEALAWGSTMGGSPIRHANTGG